MFKRRNKGVGNTTSKPKKENWFKRIFKRKPKTKTPSVNKIKSQTGSKVKHSITTLFRNKIKKSKLNVKDIALIDGMDANDLKKRFSISGSNAKILDGMVADYKDGKLAVPGLSNKSKEKPLDKSQLKKMIKEYDEVRRKRDLTEARQNVNQLKKKFSLSKSQEKELDKVVEELNKGKGSKLELGKVLLDPKKLTKDRVQDIVKQYGQAKQKKRGLSYLSGNLSFIVASKEKIHELMSNLSGKLKKLNL